MTITGSVVRSREKASRLGSPGRMSLANGFSSVTLELPWRNNDRGISCTKPGPDDPPEVYLGKVWYSPTLKRLVIRYEDKNGRHDCLVHNGNWAADAEDLDGDGIPEVTQVHGCTEVGRGYGDVLRKDGKKQWGIMASVPTLAALIESLRVEDLTEADTILEVDGHAVGFHDVQITYSWS